MFSLDTETFCPANTVPGTFVDDGKQVRRTDYPYNHQAARSVRKSQCEKASENMSEVVGSMCPYTLVNFVPHVTDPVVSTI